MAIIEKIMKEEKMIRVITQHAGRACWNGGEYREGYDLIPHGEGEFIRKYWSSSDFFMCPVTGQYNSCKRCNRNFCEEYEVEIDKIVEELLEKYGYDECDYEETIYKEVKDGFEKEVKEVKYIEIDATGHDYAACNHEGGCIICHPCNHVDCAGD